MPDLFCLLLFFERAWDLAEGFRPALDPGRDFRRFGSLANTNGKLVFPRSTVILAASQTWEPAARLEKSSNPSWRQPRIRGSEQRLNRLEATGIFGLMISIIVADDHGIVREGLRRLLESEPDFKVSAEAANGREVLRQVAATEPDVVVLDITMPDLGGLETLERIRSKHKRTKVVLLSVHSDSPFIQSAVALGADGYVLKNGPATEIVTAIREVMNGGSYFSPAVAREIVEQLRSPQTKSEGPYSLLSNRELEVLRLIADGLSAKEVAVELSISTKTVEAHRTSLMRKVNVRKATELVRYALRHGLIEP